MDTTTINTAYRKMNYRISDTVGVGLKPRSHKIEAFVHDICHVALMPEMVHHIIAYKVADGNDMFDVVDGVIDAHNHFKPGAKWEMEMDAVAASIHIFNRLGILVDVDRYLAEIAKTHPSIEDLPKKVKSRVLRSRSKTNAEKAMRLIEKWAT